MLTQSEMYAEAPRETSRKGGMAENPLKEDDDADLDDDDEDLGPMTDFSAADFEVTVVKEPFANLKEILNEQIMLTIPMQPKPDMNEKGDCVKCGKPQAAMQTQVTDPKPLKENPFAVLKDYNKKKH
jgi:hypothetical protein